MRLYSILRDLLQAQTYVTLDYFMNTYHVSKRTIQKDLSYLIQMSSRKGYQLHLRRSQGYLMEVTNIELLDEFMESLSGDQILDSKDRIKNIMAYLALQNDYITMDQIADVLSISKSSVKKEMTELEKLMHSYHLTLEKKSHFGVRLLGSDKDVKVMLVDLYFDNNTLLFAQIDAYLHDFQNVSTALLSSFEKEDLNINYNELKNVIVWLQITTWYAHHKQERQDTTLVEHSEQAIERIAWRMKKELERTYDIHINTSSFQLLLEVLRKNVRQKTPQINFSDRLHQDVDDFLQDIDACYRTEFQKDVDFKQSLLQHVSLLIERLHQKISYKNSIINEICIRYPMLFNIAIQFSDMLKDKYNVEVTQDEAGFIAMHFAAHMERERHDRMQRFSKIAVVCSSGGGSAFLIKLQIESLFGSGNVETFNHLQMEELEHFHPDLIFTIMPLNHEFAAPVIYIKELLDDQDLLRIRQVLQYDNYDSLSIEDAQDYIYTVFHKEFFHIRKADSYLALISEMAQQIEDGGYGGKHYKDYVLERETYMNTIYMNGVCIPHPIEIHCDKNLISVCILEHPIYQEGKEVRMIFMISLTKECYEMHKDITRKLYQLMKDEKMVQRIVRTKNFEEMMIVLKEVEGKIE